MKPLVLAVLCLAPLFARAAAPIPVQRPLLSVRYPSTPGGYTAKKLVKNLEWTQKNIDDLVDYLEPRRADAAIPSGPEAAGAMRDLLAESAACAALIAEGQSLLDKGVMRSTEAASSAIVVYTDKPILARVTPSAEDLERDVATERQNVAGHMGVLIALRTARAVNAAKEAAVLERLNAARLRLAETDHRFAHPAGVLTP